MSDTLSILLSPLLAGSLLAIMVKGLLFCQAAREEEFAARKAAVVSARKGKFRPRA